jgi:hypothetical protein
MTPVIVHHKTIQIIRHGPRYLGILLDKNNVFILFGQLPGNMGTNNSGSDNYNFHSYRLNNTTIAREKTRTRLPVTIKKIFKEAYPRPWPDQAFRFDSLDPVQNLYNLSEFGRIFGAKRQKPGFPLQVPGFANANPAGFPLQSLARAPAAARAYPRGTEPSAAAAGQTGTPYRARDTAPASFFNNTVF